MESTSLLEKISALDVRAKKAFLSVFSVGELEKFFQEFLGKNSDLIHEMKQLKNLSEAAKKEVGPQLKNFQQQWNQQYEQKKQELETAELNQKLKKEWIDISTSKSQKRGTIHPLFRVLREVEQIFTSMSFEIADGPQVETEWHNFDALNIPASHPARDMQDTFFIRTDRKNTRENLVLRTHTSNIQIRYMQNHKPPIRIIAPGRVFRNEDIDATHDATFDQVEGLVVDKNISLGHLKGCLEAMLSKLFAKETAVRFRPGYFPFVEPGLEVDIWFEPSGKKGKWLEFMGAGMVHPNVLKNIGIDPKEFGGFAFGFGLTRLVMMRYGIDDIRLLASAKQEFLTQF